jgi:broad specificity phosphatase PhoE
MGKKYVIVLRHGPTNKDETINYSDYINFTHKILLFLSTYLSENGVDLLETDAKIYTSPYKRCVETSKLLSSYLRVMNPNKKIKIKSDSGIRRWDRDKESREKSISRSYDYGNHIYNKINLFNNDCVYIYISHSSIIPSFINGILGKKLEKTKLHTACVSIINISDRKLEIFNKKFK